MRYHTRATSIPSHIPSQILRVHPARRGLATAVSAAAVIFLLSACFEPPKSGGSGSSSGATAPSSGSTAPPPMPMDAASSPKQ